MSRAESVHPGLGARLRTGSLLLVLSLALLVAGCAPRPALSPLAEADLAFASGDLAAATQAYEACLAEGLAGGEADRLLFRLGMLYSAPDSPVADRPRGQKLLARLVAHYPDSPYRDQARYVLDLEGRILGLRVDLQRRHLQAAELEARLVELELTLQDRTSELEAELARRRAAIAELRRQLEELEAKLEELKRIDLGQPPPGDG